MLKPWLLFFIYSPYQNNQNVQRFASWFLFSKLDFGYISYFVVSKVFNCNVEYERMVKIQYYWQSTFLNYFSLLSAAVLFISLFVILQYLMKKIDWLSYVYNFVCVIECKQNIGWIVLHLQCRFILVNIIYDTLSMRNHMALSMVSFLIFLISVIYLLIKDPSVFTSKFLEEVDQTTPVTVTALSMIMWAFEALLFATEIFWMNILLLIY